MTKERKQYLIVKRELYYRPNCQGYTGIKEEAGRYSLDECTRWVAPDQNTRNSDGEYFIHEDDAPEYSKSCFDDVKEKHLSAKNDALHKRIAELEEILISIMSVGQSPAHDWQDSKEMIAQMAQVAIRKGQK